MSTIDDSLDTFADLLSHFVGVPFPSPTHPFIWKHGEMIDLGTLGGPDAFVASGCVNQSLAVGSSLTSATPEPDTGFPPLHPFVFERGKMIDLGSLGGTIGSAQCGNNRGQVIGQSFLAGNLTVHPFLWERGILKDLGTLGGDNGIPIWINDAGEVVGEADVAGSQTSHAFLWRRGVMTDLGTLGDNSHATAINSKGQVVGAFYISGRTEPPLRHAFLWEKGGPMVDLNTLIPANSGLELVTAENINERGEIVGVGVPARCFPDYCGHLFLLIPCTSHDSEGCQDNGESPNAAVQSDPEPIVVRSASTQARQTPKERVAAWRAQMASRYHIASRRTSTK
jgi:probable HAF family extracellular repeat protein